MLLALESQLPYWVLFNVDDSVVKLPNRSFFALYRELSLIVATTVYRYFEGTNRGYH